MEDLLKPDIKEQVQIFNDNLSNWLKDDNFQLEEGECLNYEDEDVDEYENDNVNFIESDIKETVERDDYNDDAYDQLLSAEVLLPNDAADGHIRGTVLKRLKNNMGRPVGTRHSNPMLDSRTYVVKMSDGMERELQHNIIAENMFTQADSEGRQYMLLSEIVNVGRFDTAVDKKDGIIVGKNGNKHKIL